MTTTRATGATDDALDQAAIAADTGGSVLITSDGDLLVGGAASDQLAQPAPQPKPGVGPDADA